MSNIKNSPKARRPKGKGVILNVDTQFIEEQDKCQSNNKEIPPTNIYSFSSHGKLISIDKIKGEGTSRITLDARVNDTITLAVGPEFPEKIQTLEELKRYKPEVKQLKIVDDVLDVKFLLPSHQWLCWFLSRCVVPGNLYKDYGDDAPDQNFPIGNASVEIYEVDPFRLWLPKVPDRIIDKLKDRIINRPEPINPPIPPIEPIEVPERTPFPPMPKSRFGAAMRKGDGFKKIKMLSELPEYKTLQVEAKTQSNFEFRQTLLAKPKLILPFLCYYFPHIVSMQKLTEATTDSCGKFTGVFYRGCNNSDKPDLYFKVKQQIPGKGEVTIYEKKPVSCYTYWNYRCGTEVTLRSTHPDAIANQPCNHYYGDYIYFNAIGKTSLEEVYGCGASGTNSANRGLLKGQDPGSPFAANLYFRAEFSPSLRAQGIKYYRLSIREPGGAENLEVLDTEIKRYYLDNSTPGDVKLKSYTLGPLDIGTAIEGKDNLFEIPARESPEGFSWIPHPSSRGGKFYNSISIGMWDTDKDLDTPTDRLNQAGKYEVVMQLFDEDLKEVDIDDFTEGLYYLPNTASDSEAPIRQRDASTLSLIQAGYTSKKAFIFTLHIDNNQCVGNIQAANISGTPAGECCGTLEYASSTVDVTMPFVAQHPNGFGNYSFSLRRGDIPLSGLTETGQAVVPPPAKKQASSAAVLLSNDTTPVGGVIIPAHLPAGCAGKVCDNAAFVEHLYVNAWATNGISPINAYDAHDFRAFALMKAD